jgi:hypothetical protein
MALASGRWDWSFELVGPWLDTEFSNKKKTKADLQLSTT